MAMSEVPGWGGGQDFFAQKHFSRRFGPWGSFLSKNFFFGKIAAKTEKGAQNHSNANENFFISTFYSYFFISDRMALVSSKSEHFENRRQN